jgi:hypothetical protein
MSRLLGLSLVFTTTKHRTMASVVERTKTASKMKRLYLRVQGLLACIDIGAPVLAQLDKPS